MDMGKFLVMLSGGLDSLLVVKILKEQVSKENILAVYFKLPFYNESSVNETEKRVREFCKKEEISLEIFDATKGDLFNEYFKEVVTNPKFGRGACMNSCIDCRLFMLKKAKKIADERGYFTLVTGEVLNERPMSQHQKALNIVRKELQAEGRLLRPLSAKLLSETEVENKGIIDRKKTV